MCFGLYLGITEQLQIHPAHAHGALLGGVWGMGFSYLHTRIADDAPVAGGLWQWLAFNLGTALFVAGLWLMLSGTMTPLIPIGPIVVLLSTIWIAVSLWTRMK